VFGLDQSLLARYGKWPLILLLMAITVLGLTNWLLQHQKTQLLLAVQQQQAELNNLVRQVEFLREQEQLFLKYVQKYQQLMQFGLVHQQNRVQWVDGLLDIQQRLVMQPFTIQFEPEQLLTADRLEGMKIKKEIFYYTRLNIRAGLHLDSDLLKLVEYLSEQITPLFLVESCQLSKLPTERGASLFVAEKPQLFLECAILLFEAKPNPFKGVIDANAEH